jgi:hypothetical protein
VHSSRVRGRGHAREKGLGMEDGDGVFLALFEIMGAETLTWLRATHIVTV